MKHIKLIHNKFTFVDDEDYDYLNQFKWRCDPRNRAVRGTKRDKNNKQHTIIMSREIMKAPKNLQVDHKDLNTLNNQKSNLRLCNQSKNNQNRRKMGNNISGYKGVSLLKNRSKNGKERWEARLKIPQGKYLYLGYFISKDDAAKAYNEAAVKYFGEFARLNQL